MPELPEVAALAHALEKEVKSRRLLHIITKEQGGGPREGLYDDLVFSKAEEEAVHHAMEGKVLVGVGRKGKHLWMELSSSSSQQGKRGGGKGGGGDKQCVLFHMGMTGSLLYRHTSIPQYRSFTLDASQWPPKHCKAEFVFEGDIHLAFCDQRRWGRLLLLPPGKSPEEEAPVRDLAPDAWKELPPLHVFQPLLQGGKSGSGLPVKAALLDQNKIVSGVGNWVADEVLYQAKVDPAKKCSALSNTEIQAIHDKIHYVCDTACQANAQSEAFPPEWLFHFRWTNKAKASTLLSLKKREETRFTNPPTQLICLFVYLGGYLNNTTGK